MIALACLIWQVAQREEPTCREGAGSDRRFAHYQHLASASKDPGVTNEQLLTLRKGTEDSRIRFNTLQPPKVRKYTPTGFTVMTLADVAPYAWELIEDFYTRRKDEPREVEEWPAHDTYVNHWQSQTLMIRFPKQIHDGSSDGLLKQRIMDELRPALEEWSGVALVPTSLYGLRVYTEGSVLNSHVDQIDTHVISAVINVDQNLTEEWPMEIYAHDNLAHNVTLARGQVLLYESASCVHGRPYPLQGTAFVNAFAHFKPYIPAEYGDEDRS